MSLRGSRVGGVPTDEGVFGTGALNENIVGVIVRAAVSGEDASEPATSRNVPIAARTATTDAGFGFALQGLEVNARIAGLGPADFLRISARNADADGDFAAALIALLVNSRTTGLDNTLGDWGRISADLFSAISGRTASGSRGLYTASIVGGIDNTGAAVLRPVEARDFDVSADVVGSLIGLLVNSRNSFFDLVSGWAQSRGDFVSAIAAAGRTTSSFAGAHSLAGVFGIDTTGANVMRPVEARDADANADMAAALIGLLTNSRLAVFDRGSAIWAFLAGDLGSAISGISPTLTRGAYVNATLVGHDNTGAVVMRVPEARNYDTSNDVAAALIGLLVNSRTSIPDSGSLAWFLSSGSRETPTGETAFAGFVEGRESGYHSSNRGRRFIATSQTAGATLTAQTAFVATTPTLMLRQAAGATETEVVRSISITSFAATPAGIRVVVMLDPDDRFSAGGTTVVPQNPNEGSAAASGITSFLENPTATAADADERIIYNEGFAGGIGAKLVLEFKDELILSGVGTILVYVFDSAGAVAPTIAYNFEYEEYV
jgi:hypothetical protein